MKILPPLVGNLIEEIYMDNQYLTSFKNGVADALLVGTQDDRSPRPAGYKAGYDFGITLYCRQQGEEDD